MILCQSYASDSFTERISNSSNSGLGVGMRDVLQYNKTRENTEDSRKRGK